MNEKALLQIKKNLVSGIQQGDFGVVEGQCGLNRIYLFFGYDNTMW